MGWVLTCHGQTAEALAAYELARADQEALVAISGATNQARSEWQTQSMVSACCCQKTGKMAEAETEYRAALEIRRDW